MTNRVERWLERLNQSQRALWVLFWASVAETIIVPIPIELVLIPFMLANLNRLWISATVVLAGCLLASLIGYGVGLLFFDTLGRWLIETMAWDAPYAEFQRLFGEYGFFAIVAIGVIPIPFQIAMLVAGAAHYPVLKFVAAAVIARGVRYYGLAVLVHLFGERATQIWREHKITASVVGGLLLLGLFTFTLLFEG